MERQEPQGEEQRVAAPHYGHHPHGHALGQYQPPPPYHDRLAAQQIASNNIRREALRLDAMLALSRHSTPAGTPAPGPASPPRVAAAAISSLAILVHFTKPRNSIEG